MTEQVEETPLLDKVSTSSWYGPATAWVLGVTAIAFLSFLGLAVQSSTELIDVSGSFITSVRMASIGLGTGYYIGSSLRHRESGKSWFLFGVFSALSVLAYVTADTMIAGQYPAYILLILGSILTIVAHATPLVVKNEDYLNLLRYLAGYASTAVVVFLATMDYVLSLILFCWGWFQSLPLIEKGGLMVLAILATYVWYILKQDLDESRIKSEAQDRANREMANVLGTDEWEDLSKSQRLGIKKMLIEDMEFDSNESSND